MMICGLPPAACIRHRPVVVSTRARAPSCGSIWRPRRLRASSTVFTTAPVLNSPTSFSLVVLDRSLDVLPGQAMTPVCC